MVCERRTREIVRGGRTLCTLIHSRDIHHSFVDTHSRRRRSARTARMMPPASTIHRRASAQDRGASPASASVAVAVRRGMPRRAGLAGWAGRPPEGFGSPDGGKAAASHAGVGGGTWRWRRGHGAGSGLDQDEEHERTAPQRGGKGCGMHSGLQGVFLRERTQPPCIIATGLRGRSRGAGARPAALGQDGPAGVGRGAPRWSAWMRRRPPMGGWTRRGLAPGCSQARGCAARSAVMLMSWSASTMACPRWLPPWPGPVRAAAP
jgi:hypothetical protein